MQRYVHVMAGVEATLAQALATVARACSRRPKTTIVTFVVVCLYLIAGLFVLTTTEEGTRELWTDQHSEEMRNLIYVENTFSARARLNQLYITADSGGEGVLTLAAMQAVLQLHDELMAVRLEDGRGYADICEASPSSASGCNLGGPPRFWGFNLTTFLEQESNDTTVAQSCAAETYPDGQPVVRDVDFGAFVLEGVNGSLARARAVILSYPVRAAEEEAALEWEAAFIDIGLERPRAALDVRVNAERSIDDQLAVSVGGDFLLVGATYTMMIAFVSVTLGKTCDRLNGRWALASADVLAIILAIGAAYGLVVVSGVAFTSLVQVLPFILIGVGIDSAYVLVAAFDRTPLSMAVPDRVYESVFEAGMSITVTSGTNFIAFIFGAFTALPAVQIFGKYAGCSIAFIYIVHLTVFPALLALDAARVRQGRRDMLCCVRIPGAGGPAKPLGRPPSTLTAGDVEDSTSANTPHGLDGDDDDDDGTAGDSVAATSRMRLFFRDTYGAALLRPRVKAAVLVLFSVVTGLGAWQATTIENSFSLTLLAPDDSYLQDFYSLQLELFGSLANGEPIGLFFKSLDYGSRDVQVEMRRVSDEMLAADSVAGGKGRIDWHEAFTAYAVAEPALAGQLDDGYLVGAGFETAVAAWLALPQFARFQSHVVSGSGGAITASRFVFFLENSADSSGAVAALEETTRISDESSLAPDVFASASSYVFYDQYRIIVPLAVSSFSFAVGAVVLVSGVLLVHPAMVLICAVNLAMMFACLLGSVALVWDISLSSVSLTTLLMSISLLVDSSVHIIYTFGAQRPSLSRDERVRRTLFNVGPAVFLALSTTLLGVLPLVFAQSAIFRIFLKTFVSICLFGGSFGLVFLPVVLSLIGPAVYRPEHHVAKGKATPTSVSERKAAQPAVLESQVDV